MKHRFWTVLFLVIVVCLSTGMLTTVYFHTDPMVRKNESIKVQRSVLKIFNIPYEESDIEEVFKVSVDTQTLEDKIFYKSCSGNIAFEINGSGFWGNISVLIALKPDLETISGLKILENVETPGLGGRITEDWFQDQFKGKKLIPELKIVPHGKAMGLNEVEAITGATQTSRYFERIINNNMKEFRRKMGK